MPFDSTGYTPYTVDEILNILNSSLVRNIVEETGDLDFIMNTAPDTKIGTLNLIVAETLAALSQEGENIEQGMKLSTSTGIALEKLGFLVGFYRFLPETSKGSLRFTADDNSIVNANFRVKSLKGDIFKTTTTLELKRSACRSLKFRVNSLRDEQTYSLFNSGVEFSYTSGISATQQEILVGLETEINNESNVIEALYVEDSESPELSYVKINTLQAGTDVDVDGSAFLFAYDIEGVVSAESEETGVVFGDAETITTLVSTGSGIITVTNPEDFLLGSDIEEDLEFRERIGNNFSTVGSGTRDTMTSFFDREPLIRDSLVIDNSTFADDVVTGIPAKEYECVIAQTGSNDHYIALLVNAVKPLGIENHGEVTVFIEDFVGDLQEVHFTNAAIQFAHVEVEYTKLPEEEFPNDGEELIKEAIVEDAQDYQIDEDLIGGRLMGAIYAKCSGIEDLVIRQGVTPNALDPTPALTENRIPIGIREISSYATTRISVIEV